MTATLNTNEQIQMTAKDWSSLPADASPLHDYDCSQNPNKTTCQPQSSPHDRGLQLMLVSPADPCRKDAEAFINHGYKIHFDAQLQEFSPIILMVKDWKNNRIMGAVGLRYADDYKLFSEQYLSQPIDAMMSSQEPVEISRHEIIELGHFVVDQNEDVNTVIPMVASFLKSLDVKWAVYTLSRPIKVAFQRLGIQLTHLQHAHPNALLNGRSDWGRYYDFKPAVYYSNILTNMNS